MPQEGVSSILSLVVGIVKKEKESVMFTKKLVDMIERQAEEIANRLIKDIQTNVYTETYHEMGQEELRHRILDVYRNLESWLTRKTDDEVRRKFMELGAARFEEHIPLSQIVYALMLTRIHLVQYLKNYSMTETAFEMFREHELCQSVVRFFDKAVFYTVYGYEHAEHTDEDEDYWHGFHPDS